MKNNDKNDMDRLMNLPEGRVCSDCAHDKTCMILLNITGEEKKCQFYPSKFMDDVMIIYNRDGSETKVKHPFEPLKNSGRIRNG